MIENRRSHIENVRMLRTDYSHLINGIENNISHERGHVIYTKNRRYQFESVDPYSSIWQSDNRTNASREVDAPSVLHDIYINNVIDGKCVRAFFYLNGEIENMEYLLYRDEVVIVFIFGRSLNDLIAVSKYSFAKNFLDNIIICRVVDQSVVDFIYKEELLETIHYTQERKNGMVFLEWELKLERMENGTVEKNLTRIKGYGT